MRLYKACLLRGRVLSSLTAGLLNAQVYAPGERAEGFIGFLRGFRTEEAARAFAEKHGGVVVEGEGEIAEFAPENMAKFPQDYTDFWCGCDVPVQPLLEDMVWMSEFTPISIKEKNA